GSPPCSAIDPSAGASKPAISRSSEVLPDPLAPVTASTSPPDATKSSPANTVRPPRTHVTPRPESRISPLYAPCTPPEIRGVAHHNLWVPDCCKPAPGCGGAIGKIL